MSSSLLALLGFIAWTLSLLVIMEVFCSRLAVTGAVPANAFNPGNCNLSPFMQRLARVHANCLESLPIFGGLLLGGSSLSVVAVKARFTAFAARLGIAVDWVWALFVGGTGLGAPAY